MPRYVVRNSNYVFPSAFGGKKSTNQLNGKMEPGEDKISITGGSIGSVLPKSLQDKINPTNFSSAPKLKPTTILKPTDALTFTGSGFTEQLKRIGSSSSKKIQNVKLKI